MVRDGLLLQTAVLYGNAASAELAHQAILDASQHDVVRPHNDVEDTPVLILIQAESASNPLTVPPLPHHSS